MGAACGVSAEGTATRAVTSQIGSLKPASSSRNTAWEGQVRDRREEVHVRQRANC